MRNTYDRALGRVRTKAPHPIPRIAACGNVTWLWGSLRHTLTCTATREKEKSGTQKPGAGGFHPQICRKSAAGERPVGMYTLVLETRANR